MNLKNVMMIYNARRAIFKPGKGTTRLPADKRKPSRHSYYAAG